MNDSDFVTIFDVAKAGYRSWWFPAFGLIFVAVGVLMPRLVAAGLWRADAQKLTWFRPLWIGFSIFWTATAFLATFGPYWMDRQTLLSARADYVEGPVQDFVPMPYGGHAQESFVVNEVPFHYSDFIVTGGFNNTASHGGPIREGRYVRIWYSGNDILRLQVMKDSRS